MEVNIALVGHTDDSVHGNYGAKDKAVRFRHRLAEAVASVTYDGLDLFHIRGASKSTNQSTDAMNSTAAVTEAKCSELDPWFDPGLVPGTERLHQVAAGVAGGRARAQVPVAADLMEIKCLYRTTSQP